MYFTREGFYDASTQVFPPQFSQIRSRGRRSRPACRAFRCPQPPLQPSSARYAKLSTARCRASGRRGISSGMASLTALPPPGTPAGQPRRTPPPGADAKDCTVPGAAAYQYSTCALGTEDCLKLDVYTTEKASKRPSSSTCTAAAIRSAPRGSFRADFWPSSWAVSSWGWNTGWGCSASTACPRSAPARRKRAILPCWTWPRRWTGCGTISHRSAATRRTSQSSALQPAGGTEWPCWPVPCLWAGSRKPSLFPAA